MILFILQPFKNKEHVVVFTMPWVAVLSKLNYLKYNLSREVLKFYFSEKEKFNLAFLDCNQEFSLHLYPLPGFIHPHNSK